MYNAVIKYPHITIEELMDEYNKRPRISDRRPYFGARCIRSAYATGKAKL